MSATLRQEESLSLAPLRAAACLVLSAVLLSLALAIPPALGQGGGRAAVHVDPVRPVPLSESAPVLGRLVATRAGAVAARVDAPVESFVVEVGDRVARGDTLVLLDDERLSAQRDQADAALAEARARLQTSREERALARQALDRLTRLRDSAAFSQASFEDQRQEVAIARAEVASAEATVARAEADLRLAAIDVKHAEIRAPYAGVVTERPIEAGAYVTRGATVLRLVSDRKLEVEADVPVKRLAGLRVGAEVQMALADDRRFTGTVRAILPQENPRTRTRPVRFVPDFGPGGGDHRYAAGESVTVAVPLGDSRTVLSVHKDAVIRRGEETVIFVYADGSAQVRPVRLGAEVGERFAVLDGLTAGDLAVVRGNERLRPGQPLTIEKRLGPAAGAAGEAAPESGRDGTG